MDTTLAFTLLGVSLVGIALVEEDKVKRRLTVLGFMYLTIFTMSVTMIYWSYTGIVGESKKEKRNEVISTYFQEYNDTEVIFLHQESEGLYTVSSEDTLYSVSYDAKTETIEYIISKDELIYLNEDEPKEEE